MNIRKSSRMHKDYLELVELIRPAVWEFGIRKCITPGGYANPDLTESLLRQLKEDRKEGCELYSGKIRRRWIEDIVIQLCTSGGAK